MMSKAKLIVSLCLMSIVILFVFQNANLVQIRFFFWTISMSGALLFLLLFMTGAFVGWLLLSHYKVTNVDTPR